MENLNEIIAALITGIITGYFSFKLTIHQEKNAYAKERYEKLLFPIFMLIEPHLYAKEITPEINSTIKLICTYMQKNRIYENGRLLEIINLCSNELKLKKSVSEYNFINLCSIISIEYDNSCKKLGINKRTFLYKLNNNQIHPDKITIMNQFIKYLIYVVIFGVIFTLGYILFLVITTLLNLINI